MRSGASELASPAAVEPAQALALRLAIAAALLTFVAGLYARTLDLLRTDVPLRSSDGRFFWIVCLLTVVAFGMVIGRLPLERTRSYSSSPQPATAPANGGILPALLVLTGIQLIVWDSRAIVVVAAPLLVGAGVFTASVVRHYLLSGDESVLAGARLVHLVLTGGTAFLTLSLLRGWMGGAGYSLVAAFVLSTLLLVQALDGVRAFPIRRFAYALAGGVVVAEVALAMSYLPPSPWIGGAFLTTVFAIVMLTIDAIMSRRISTDVVTRYVGAGVAICGLLVVLAR